MEETEDSKIVTWKEIVAKLVIDAVDLQVKECLRMYDPAKPSAFLRTVFKKIKNETLNKTLIYLQCTNLPKNPKKEELIDILIS